MADSDARTGFGALLQRSLGGSPEPDFLTILGIKSIDGPSISRDTHDTTVMTSPGGWREFIGGLKDGGEVSFEANFLPTDPTQNQTAGGFMAEFDKGSCDSKGNWRILLPKCDGEPDSSWEFEGVVTGQEVEIPLEDVMGFNGTIKVSGRPERVIEQSA